MRRNARPGIARVPARDAIADQVTRSAERSPSTTSPGQIRRAIRAELPSHVFSPQPARALIALALCAAIVVTDAAIQAFTEFGAAAILLSVLSGGLCASLFFLGHECGHGAILKRRWAQDLLMFPAFLIFVLSPTLWRVWHNDVHHVRTNSAVDDPDNFGSMTACRQSRIVGLVAAMTPGSGRWRTLLYFAIWFTVHAQVVQWIQSYRCGGFEALDRRRAAVETLLMAGFWLGLGLAIGAHRSVLVIVLPMMIANAIIMSYISTNHLLRPLLARPNPLDDSMSVATHPLLDRIHFNFSYHVEHHLFPPMSPKFAPLIRLKLHQHAPRQLLVPSHLAALQMVFRSPRIHDDNGDLVDPKTGRRLSFSELTDELRRLQEASVAAERKWT
jgi:fatty acid desaturase